MMDLLEEREFRYATLDEWDREDALERGRENPNVCWIVTNRDVIRRNPFYVGPDVPYPE
jgi:hypothetical protein